MPRTTTASMDAHLAQKVTTLATIWSIAKRDGTTLRFTDHDQDIVFDSNTYESEDGYFRSEIIARADGSPDNFSVKGPLTDTGITLQAIQELDYDGATINIAIVNWQDLSAGMGSIIYQSGEVGEVRSEKVGQYILEARGLTQRMSKRVGEVVTTSCRADLFDSRCSNASVGDSVQQADFEFDAEITAVGDRKTFTTSNESLGDPDLDLTTGAGNSITENADGSLTYDATVPDGTEAYPWEVSTADELQALDNNTLVGAFYIQTADIDLSTVSGGLWNPIQDMDSTYDGQGFRIHTYSGLVLTPVSSGGGVFADITATGTVKNLMLEDLDFSYSISAKAGVLAGASLGAISDILLRNCTWTINATTQSANIGGLVAEVNGTHSVSNVYSDVTITDNSTSNSGTIEGIIGRQIGGTGTYSGLYYNADVLTIVPTVIALDSVFGANALEEWEDKSRYSFSEFDFKQMWKTAVSFGSTDIPVVIDQTALTVTRSAGNWVTEGFLAGHTISLQDALSTKAFVAKVSVVTATILTVDSGELPNEEVTLVHARGGLNDIDMMEKGLTDGVQQLAIKHPDRLRGLYASGTLSWTEVTPGTSAVLVEVSKDLDTYTSLSSGAALPNFSASESLLGDYLGIRITLTPDGANLPVISDMALTFLTDAKPLGSTDNQMKYGTVKFLTGNNATKSFEMKSSVAATGVITTFLKLPAAMQVGDTFTMIPGCPKDLFACVRRYRNVKNFRGEPYTPGQDHLLQILSFKSGTGADVQTANDKSKLQRDLDVTA